MESYLLRNKEDRSAKSDLAQFNAMRIKALELEVQRLKDLLTINNIKYDKD